METRNIGLKHISKERKSRNFGLDPHYTLKRLKLPFYAFFISENNINCALFSIHYASERDYAFERDVHVSLSHMNNVYNKVAKKHLGISYSLENLKKHVEIREKEKKNKKWCWRTG